MRILYVVSRPLEINASSSIRNKATIEGLLNLGHNVDLITTQFDKNHSNYDESILNKGLKITYLKIGGIQGLAKLGRKFRFLKHLRQFAYKIMRKYEIYDNLKGIVEHITEIDINDDKYDIIISSSDPKSSHLFVSKMFEKRIIKDTPWIQIWGDPFLSDITRKNSILNYKIKEEENRLLRFATKVIYVSSLTLKEQQRIYPHYKSKMFYEPIPYAKKEIYPIRDNHECSLTFLYCGDYSSNIRNLKPLYEAIDKSRHNMVICGNSDLKFKSTERIKISTRISFNKTKELERNCDVLVHLSNLKGSQIPGKIYQYSGTNKLILFILDGEKNDLLESFQKYDRYIFCQNDLLDIEKAIFQIQNGLYNNTRFVVEDFNPSLLAGKMIKI